MDSHKNSQLLEDMEAMLTELSVLPGCLLFVGVSTYTLMT